MKTLFNGRELEIENMEIPSGGHDYWCDAYVISAYWLDTDEALTDEELDVLNEHAEEYVQQYIY